jgi:PAS domain-containing protein
MLRLPAIFLVYAIGSPAAAEYSESLPAPEQRVTPASYATGFNPPFESQTLYATSSGTLTNAEPAQFIAQVTAPESGSELNLRNGHTPVRETFLLYGLPGLLLLSTVLIIVVRVNRQLSSEITRRMELEQELRSSEYHYRGMVESLSAIAWEANPEDYRYSYVSPQAESQASGA